MAAEEARKLFVAGLPDTITEEILRQLFEATGGTVVEVSLPKDRATGRPRGFGFVTLATSADAQMARDTLDGSMQAGRSISVRPFQAEPPVRREGGPPGADVRRGGDRPPPINAPDRTIYVGNLPYDATQVEVETLFSERNAGPIVRVSLPTDDDGRKRGFGFVSMPSAEGASAAIEALRGADIRGRNLVINLAYPKGDRPPRENGPGGGPQRFGGPPGEGGSPSGGFGGPPRPAGNFGPPRPPSTGPGAAPKRTDAWKKKKEGEGEGKRSNKSWDRERGGRFDLEDDWDKEKE
jgi:RNA recognition motif-containing protein